MLIARIETGALVEYPLYRSDLCARFPNTSFPQFLTAECLPEGYAPVLSTAAPAFARWQAVRELAPVLTDGQWLQAWEVLEAALTMEEKKAQVYLEINAIAAQKRNLAVAGAIPAEMVSWPIKRAEALAYRKSGEEADAPSLAVEAQARGVSLTAMVDIVIQKASALTALEAAIAGRLGALKDAVALAADETELLGIVPGLTAGWPEINQ